MTCQQCFYYGVGISAAKTVNHDFDHCFASPEVIKIPNREKPCRYFKSITEYAKNTEQQFQPDNGGECTRPEITNADCHAKNGSLCMNGIICPPLQVK